MERVNLIRFLTEEATDLIARAECVPAKAMAHLNEAAELLSLGARLMAGNGAEAGSQETKEAA